MDDRLLCVLVRALDVVVYAVENGALLHHEHGELLEEHGQVVDRRDQRLYLLVPPPLRLVHLIFLLYHVTLGRPVVIDEGILVSLGLEARLIA